MSQNFGWQSIALGNIPRLLPGEIHVYATLLTPDTQWESIASQVLSTEESQRAARFRFEADRYRFQKTRAALRQLLAAYLAKDPKTISFREGPHGKPYLHEADPGIQFNVSHTRGASVLAFSHNIEVGIDIEHSRRKVDVEGVGRKVFTPSEQDTLRELGTSSALKHFFRLWTAKEAYLKATGSGLSCDPSTVQTDLQQRRFTQASDPTNLLPYTLRELSTTNGFQVCLAHQQCPEPKIHLQEIQ